MIVKFSLWLSASGLALLLSIFGGVIGLIIAIIFFVIIGLILILVILVLPNKGLTTPRYLSLYKLPFGVFSWNFDNYLGLSARDGKDIRISSFQAQIKINARNGVNINDAYIESDITGDRLDLLFDAKDGYKKSSDISKIPIGHWYRVTVPLKSDELDYIEPEELLKKYSGFSLIVEYDKGKFRKRFKRTEIEMIIDNFRSTCNQAPIPMIR